MKKPWYERFRRITSGGEYLPQVDGMRFIAIFLVVCVAHIPGFINQKHLHDVFARHTYWQQFSLNGVMGVQLFFMISGLVLGLGFLQLYTSPGNKGEGIKKYYLRRLTRIEPPYVVALVLFFLVLVYGIKKYSFQQLLPSFWASLFYVHSAVYENNSFVLPVAWSLEIEIQFYLIAPLLSLLYLIRANSVRWALMILVILFNAYYWFDVWTGSHVLKFLHYFLAGMLLADWYKKGIRLPGNEWVGLGLGCACLLIFPFVPGLYNGWGYAIKCLLMFLLFFFVMTNRKMAALLSFTPLALIGGMCYSIYLVHEQVMSGIGRVLPFRQTGYWLPDSILFFLETALLILLASGLFFLAIEKPCMRRGWWKGIFRRRDTTGTGS